MPGTVLTDSDGTRYEVVDKLPSPAPSQPTDGGTSAPPPSAPAPEGTPLETVVSGAVEGGGTQTPAPSPAPAPAAGEVAPPAPPAPQEPAPFATPDEQAAAVTRLDDFLKEQVETAKREAQGLADKRINAIQEEMKKDREARVAQEKELREEIRNLQLQGLQPEEQARLKKVWEQDDRTVALDAHEKELDSLYKSLVTAKAVMDYGQFGVEEGDLQGLAPEEVQVFCAEAKAAFYEEKAKAGSAQQAAPAQAVAPAPAAPAPQGVHAPSDVGGGGGSVPPPKFNENTGEDAMLENLKSMQWQAVPQPVRQ